MKRLARLVAIPAICLTLLGCEPSEWNRWAAWWRGVAVLDGVGGETDPTLFYIEAGGSTTYQSCVEAAERRGGATWIAEAICHTNRWMREGSHGNRP